MTLNNADFCIHSDTARQKILAVKDQRCALQFDLIRETHYFLYCNKLHCTLLISTKAIGYSNGALKRGACEETSCVLALST